MRPLSSRLVAVFFLLFWWMEVEGLVFDSWKGRVEVVLGDAAPFSLVLPGF